jgi:Spx/MgsR family transcriptional regulator
MITLYGISNCDTIKKTKQWLCENGVEYHFHDYRKQGIDSTLCLELLEALPLATLINTRGTTWRGLPEQTRAQFDSRNAASVMQEWPALIRRPLIRSSQGWLTSADPAVLCTLLPHS